MDKTKKIENEIQFSTGHITKVKLYNKYYRQKLKYLLKEQKELLQILQNENTDDANIITFIMKNVSVISYKKLIKLIMTLSLKAHITSGNQIVQLLKPHNFEGKHLIVHYNVLSSK